MLVLKLIERIQAVAVVLFFCAQLGLAQTNSLGVSGIYLSRADFENNVVSYPHETDLKNSLRTDVNRNVILIREGLATKFKYGSVFGFLLNGEKYVGCGKNRTWFSEFGYLKLEDAGLAFVYSKKRSPNESITFYYYNRVLGDPVNRLTLRNIAREFADQKELISALKKYRAISKDRLDRRDQLDDEKVLNGLLRKYIKTS